ncbi:hypothetical protein BGZ65_010141 [Modicella reniformis]|uniref:Uncharacterized protein n=1 Tax=Modicella reniformis TaxID=1440133 RepID=A0A9P6IMG9_9FUNG|nr:hypothetical protein BGZ65_010141 [Modicella reniformis]
MDSKQFTAHKADGLVYGTAKNLEYCVTEMAKKDQGQFATKDLNDTHKLAKMKNVRDEIRKLATVNVRGCLVVYGVRIAGPTGSPEGLVDGCDHDQVIDGRPCQASGHAQSYGRTGLFYP